MSTDSDICNILQCSAGRNSRNSLFGLTTKFRRIFFKPYFLSFCLTDINIFRYSFWMPLSANKIRTLILLDLAVNVCWDLSFAKWKLFFFQTTGFSWDQRSQRWQGDYPRQQIFCPNSFTTQWNRLSVARIISVDRVKLVWDCLAPEGRGEIQALEWDINNIKDQKTKLWKTQNLLLTLTLLCYVCSRERKGGLAWMERGDQRWTIVFCLVYISLIQILHFLPNRKTRISKSTFIRCVPIRGLHPWKFALEGRLRPNAVWRTVRIHWQ